METPVTRRLPAPRFIRYQSTVPHRLREGVYLGVFAMLNTLAKQGKLSPAQEAFRRAENDWFDAHLPLPTAADPALYDEAAHPLAVAWFKRTAATHLARVPGYLAILDAHGVGWHALESDDPSTILYEDAFQVVATPCPRGPH
jgi:hypothetical protein